MKVDRSFHADAKSNDGLRTELVDQTRPVLSACGPSSFDPVQFDFSLTPVRSVAAASSPAFIGLSFVLLCGFHQSLLADGK